MKKQTAKPVEPYPPAEWWESNGLPVPIAEHMFYPGRKWRFDYYFPDYRVAIEIEGGAFKYGRHNRAVGFLKDMIKYNAAAGMGIIILRYSNINKINIKQVENTLKNRLKKS